MRTLGPQPRPGSLSPRWWGSTHEGTHVLDITIRRPASASAVCRLDGDLTTDEATGVRAITSWLRDTGHRRGRSAGRGPLRSPRRRRPDRRPAPHPHLGRPRRPRGDAAVHGALPPVRRSGSTVPHRASTRGARRFRSMSKRGGHDLVIVANRLPVQRAHDGSDDWETSPGGLVRAMLSVLHHRRGAWVGWIGAAGDAPRAVRATTASASCPCRSSEDGRRRVLRRLLQRDAVAALPRRHPRLDVRAGAGGRRYVTGQRALRRGGRRRGAPRARSVWVHDYHLQLVPLMLRELRPDVRIGFFLHIPFPPQELFMRLPWRRGDPAGPARRRPRRLPAPRRRAENFVAARPPPASTSTATAPRLQFDGRTRPRRRVPDLDRRRRVRRDRPHAPRRAAHAAQIRQPPRRPRARAARRRPARLHEGHRRAAARPSASCSRERRARARAARDGADRRAHAGSASTHYATSAPRSSELVGEINGEFGSLGYPAVHYLHQSLPLEELVALYQAADVMLVTPLRDGMNLVAKEYVASRVDEQGVLVLSRVRRRRRRADRRACW